MKTNDTDLESTTDIEIGDFLISSASWLDQYADERLEIARQFLPIPKEPKNKLEADLFKLAERYCRAQIFHFENRRDKFEEYDYSKLETELHKIFDACGMPEETAASPCPSSKDFCRDRYTLKFLDFNVDAITELAEALKVFRDK